LQKLEQRLTPSRPLTWFDVLKQVTEWRNAHPEEARKRDEVWAKLSEEERRAQAKQALEKFGRITQRSR